MASQLTVLVFTVLALLANVRALSPTDTESIDILTQLENRFHTIKSDSKNQFGVMYLPPPNTAFTQIVYEPEQPDAHLPTGAVTYPHVTNLNKDNFPHNYLATTPDDKGQEYAGMMHKIHLGITIHTEDLSLNLVYPGMANWFNQRHQQYPLYVYLFTHFLPCQRCSDRIKNFVEQHNNIHVYVGYRELYGGASDTTNPNAQQKTRDRRDDLNNYLNNKGGKLLLLTTIPVVG